MRRIYEDHAYGAGPIAQNFWPTTITDLPDWPRLGADARCDIAIVGGGYTGLTAALHLAEAGADVAVFEAETPGFGASGRNGGFCCLGGTALGPGSLIRRYGEVEARRYYAAERGAVALVRSTLDRFGIVADLHSAGETLLAHRPEAIPELKATARHMRAHHGASCEIVSRAELAAAGLASDAFHGAVTTPLGFALNPLKYAIGLAGAARAVGARLHANTPVEALRPDGAGWRISTPGGEVTARKVILATNGYSSEDMPAWLGGRFLPVQSNIMVTRPMTAAELAAQGWTSDQMCYDTRRLLHYFRLMPGGRMLFGMRGAVRGSPAALERLRRGLRADFDATFPAWRNVETAHFWSGLVAFTMRRTPFIGAVPGMENVSAGLCFHGNGVAMGSLAGKLLADLALGRPPSEPSPDFFASPPGRFPLGRFRRALLRPMLSWYRWRDGD